VTLDQREAQTCSPTGRVYEIQSHKQHPPYSHYRWVFSGNSSGAERIRIYEISLEMAQEQSPASNLIQRQVCDENATCCEFGEGACAAAALANSLVRTPLQGASYDYHHTYGILEWAEGVCCSVCVLQCVCCSVCCSV